MAEQQKEKKEKQKQKDKSQTNKNNLDLDFDKCDFPIEYSDKALVKNWFCFDDSVVKPIMPGTLQSMFGGSNASAYMLLYRQKAHNK